MPRGMIIKAMRPLFYKGTLAILLMFIFERQVDSALQLMGYDINIVSYFALVRDIHSRFVLYFDGAEKLDLAHFHMLDVALLLSIIVWGAWLTAGIVFLKKYDNDLRLLCVRLFERFQGRRLFLYFSWMFALSWPIILSNTPRTSLANPEMLFIVNHIPKVYFFAIALSYYLCGGFLLSLSVLLIVWKLHRRSAAD